MKCQVIDHKGCFEIAIEAENMEESATLARFGLNATKELRGSYVYANESNFTASIVFGARVAREVIIKSKTT